MAAIYSPSPDAILDCLGTSYTSNITTGFIGNRFNSDFQGSLRVLTPLVDTDAEVYIRAQRRTEKKF